MGMLIIIHFAENAGDDTLIGREGSDYLDGGTGIDTVSYNIAQTTGAVFVDLASGTAASDGTGSSDTLVSIENVIGSSFNDTLYGSSGANSLSGLGGNDTLIGRGGNDILDGGAGIDTADYSGAAGNVSIDLNDGMTGSGTGSDGDGGTDTLVGIENLTGGAFNDFLDGDNAVNILRGNDGDDTLKGQGGADTLDGGSGLDTISYTDSTSRIVVNLLTNSVSDDGRGSSDVLISIENVVGSAYGDTIYGDNGDNVLDGGVNIDLNVSETLMGRGGHDTLIGGGALGANNGTIASYLSAANGIIVDLSTGNVSNDGDGSTDVIVNIKNVIGSAQADIIYGNSFSNHLYGMAGDDTPCGRRRDREWCGQ